MTAPIDVFITSAEEDLDTARKLASDVTGAGMTCAIDGVGNGVLSTVTALESCRLLLFVLSPAANNAAHVNRALERASARGAPVITYAAAAAEPSPSIAYFIGTAAPIRGWSKSDQPHAIEALVAACRDALQSSARSQQRATSRSTFSRAKYADPRPLLAVLAIVLVLCCLADLYAIAHDVRTIRAVVTLAGADQAAVPVDPVSAPFLAPSATLWTIIVGSILVLRRVRLNLVARFAQNVTIGAGEIIWRPLVPFANVFWLSRMASELRRAASPGRGAGESSWRLATIWCMVLIVGHSLGVVRDFTIRIAPENAAAVAALGVAIELTCLMLAAVSYAIWRGVVDGVGPSPVAAESPVERTVAASLATPAHVLILNDPEDDRLARTIVSQLERFGCRCWTYSGEQPDISLIGFHSVLVIVSRASHASDRIVTLVQLAITARAHVVPVVLDPPPVGSPLGHYVRSLHWLDAATFFVPGHDANLGSVFATVPVVAPPSIDDRVFTVLPPVGLEALNYRPASRLRRGALAAAWLQIVMAGATGLLALIIAIDPEGAGDPSGNLSILLGGFSILAWALFLVWLSRTHKNAVALFVSGLVSRRQLLLKVGVPIVSMIAGGAMLSRLFVSIVGRGTPQVQRRAAMLQTTWTISGCLFTVCASLGWYLVAYHGLVRVAMLLTICQSAATLSRGLVRAKMIGAMSEHFGARARVRTSPRAARSLSVAT